jgi:hypothetical protein
MKSNSDRISENDTLVVDMTNQCNLFALSIGVDAAKLDELDTGSKVLADKVRSLAARTVVINSEGFHDDRYGDLEGTVISLHDLAKEGRKCKDDLNKIRKI